MLCYAEALAEPVFSLARNANARGGNGSQTMPQTDLEIRWTILFHNPFYHPAVAFRRSCFEKADRYRPEEAVSYDHYLWFDMLPFCRARNLADRLTQYRCNPRGLTSLYAIKPRNRTHRIREALWQRLGLVYDLYDDDLAADVSTFVKGEGIGAPERRFEAYRVILKVLRAFISCGPVRDGQDAAAGRRLAQQIVTRMLANAPPTKQETRKLYRLCWQLAPLRTAIQWARQRTALAKIRSGR